jgi:23S rRNA (guanosine2251-2'-O)-methyltransferase
VAAQLKRGGGRPRRRGEPGRGRLGDAEQVEGRQAVRELLRARRRRVRQLWVAGDAEPSPVLDDIESLAAGLAVVTRRVPGSRVDAMARTDASQGVVALADPLPEADFDTLLSNEHAFLVALDGVTDPRNVGSIVRSADGAGAIEHVPIARVAGIPAALDRASRRGVWTVGLDEAGRSSLFDLDLADRALVLVLGAEGRGLSRLAAKRCDLLVHIPMLGAIASLNVSVAAALACYEVARTRGGGSLARPPE